MYPFWKSNLGKLIIGGCGTQIGMLFTLAGLAALLLLCAVCVFANIFTIGLTQQFTTLSVSPTNVPVEVASSAEDVELLRTKLDFLAGRVNSLRTNVPPTPLPTPTPPPPPPRPVVIAVQSAAILRSGPNTEYNRIGRLPLGQRLEIVGRNPDSTWWLVATPGGQFAWVSDMAVATFNADETIPAITIPALLVYPAAIGSDNAAPADSAGPATLDLASSPAVVPGGTPTPAANQSRRFVQDTRGYKQLSRQLLLPTVSESFSPQGDQIAISEKIKLYTITTDGASRRILVEDNDKVNLLGGAVWSPDGKYIAFVAERLQDCDPCRTVGLVGMPDGAMTWLKPPAGLGLDLPRWTQDGRLLVTAHAGDPSQGTIHVYEAAGQSQELAVGSYDLSSSHDGQKWFPWQPGKTWQTNDSAGAQSYYGD